MTYRAPLADMHAAMRHAGLDADIAAGNYGELTPDLLASVLEEAGRFAGGVIAPLNKEGDKVGAVLKDGAVTMPPGWRDAYRAWAEAGWNGLSAPEAAGGQGLPVIVNMAAQEMWNSAALAFALGPLLTIGTIEALQAHASEDLKRVYLEKLVSGEWMGTMNLTEPQAGSDLSNIRTRAERKEDGSYRLKGQKIFITYGEHDFTDNIVHMVLARLSDAPAGTRGISLFLVPKVLVNADGSLGARNDVHCHSLEHKLGLHGSPTCTMIYGEKEGAVGYLVGEENRGLSCMFTMMNNARLGVGVQGVAIAERAMQQALAFAHERRQGRAPGAVDGPSAIVDHPDVQRMLLTMKALTQGARAICMMTAAALQDLPDAAAEPARRRRAQRASLLTPMAKAFSTDIGIEVASLGIQVHGGMGYIEETGAAQHLRDARICAIYEGTNGIQAIDLVTRKLPLDEGAVARDEIAALRRTATRAAGTGDAFLGVMAARLKVAAEHLDRATSHLLRSLAGNRHAEALAGATPYLRLFSLALAGDALIGMALTAREDGAADAAARATVARFFADNILPETAALETAVIAGGQFIDGAAAALAN